VKFVDTSFWVGLQYRRDARHIAAADVWRSLAEPLVTTNHVLGETWTFLRRRTGHPEAVRFIAAALASPTLAIHRVDEAEEVEAWEWLRHHDEREYSFVDSTSFAVMRRLRLTEALAFDGDFAAAGFVDLKPST